MSKPLFIDISYLYLNIYLNFPNQSGGAEEDRCLGTEAAHAATAVPSASLLSVPTGSDLPPPAGPANTAKHGWKHGITLESLEADGICRDSM